MLQIKDIRKQYQTGDLIQKALDGVSLTLRDNEFVSILGPSGSGKTTLLNIIGGLDVDYDGEIIINNVSTRNYKDRDWDSYRAHTIGFVFQSYNLIPHQTLLSNVELALTISGLPKAERKKKALDALDKVGLREQAHKKPNQLSGGQMQRVAIARALVNDPDILLADEPTGALDTDTSLQVMDLLKEIAEDRLVVMVTHNPELAEQYSTRIVRLRDGKIESDTDPCEVSSNEGDIEHRNLGKASMSLLTSMQLSFQNLWSKKARTILVAVAGSIGIIGIALIMSLSNGANAYIKSIEEKTLSEYPLTIGSAAFDMTTMLTSSMGMSTGTADSDTTAPDSGATSARDDRKVYELQVISSMFGTVQENDLRSLKKYLESGESGIEDDVKAIEYHYPLTPYIYKIEESGNARQVSPNALLSDTSLSEFASMFGTASSTSAFSALPRETSLYLDQYDVLEGHWPENDHELVAVLTKGNGLYDLALYNLGLKDPSELDLAMEAYQNADITNVPGRSEAGVWDFSDIIGQEFMLVQASDMYSYDKDLGIWVSRTGSAAAVNALAAEGEPLVITGIVRPKEDVDNPPLTPGFCYSADLVYCLIEHAEESEIVKAQQADPEVDIFTGKRFDDPSSSEFDMSSLFTVDEDAMGDLFDFDMDSLPDMDLGDMDLEDMEISFGDMDLSSAVDLNALSGMFDGLTDGLLERALSGVSIHVTEEALTDCFRQLYEGFTGKLSEDPSTDPSLLPDALRGYFETEAAAEVLRNALEEFAADSSEAVKTSGTLTEIASRLLLGYAAYLDSLRDPGDDPETESAEIETRMQDYLQTEDAQAILGELSDTYGELLVNFSASRETTGAMLDALLGSYSAYAEENSLPVPEKIAEAFTEYLSSAEALAILKNTAAEMIDTDRLSQNLNGIISEVGEKLGETLGSQISSAMESVGTGIAAQLSDSISQMMTAYMSDLGSSLDFDMTSLEDMISVNMSAESMKEMLTKMFSTTKSTCKGNLETLGYADIGSPDSVTFYPIDFDSKNNVIAMLDDYNARMEANGEDEKVLAYTDVVGTLTGSVTRIIDIIGYVLIAFVSISLIVSSIMIGVITYISVLERRKEIGILRAMGASKRNITEVFNCETVITGFLAGLIGVVFTWLFLIPANAILRSLTGEPDLRAFLPLSRGLILIALSVVLTSIGGLIPSKGAARQDPVIAMRSE